MDVSFELSPARPNQDAKLPLQAAAAFGKFKPVFYAVTCHTPGSVDHNLLLTLQRGSGVPVASHLTCLGAPRAAVDDVARELWRGGITRIVALRGDAPKNVPAGDIDSYACARDLTHALKAGQDFTVYTAGYPETHPDAQGNQARELDYLKQKVDAGASAILTQAVFNAERFDDFREKVAKAGINAPVVAGVMPIANFTRAQKLLGEWGVSLPAPIGRAFAAAGENASAQQQAATDVLTELCESLVDGGAEHLHFYTLNRTNVVGPVCDAVLPRSRVG